MKKLDYLSKYTSNITSDTEETNTKRKSKKKSKKSKRKKEKKSNTATAAAACTTVIHDDDNFEEGADMSSGGYLGNSNAEGLNWKDEEDGPTVVSSDLIPVDMHTNMQTVRDDECEDTLTMRATTTKATKGRSSRTYENERHDSSDDEETRGRKVDGSRRRYDSDDEESSAGPSDKKARRRYDSDGSDHDGDNNDDDDDDTSQYSKSKRRRMRYDSDDENENENSSSSSISNNANGRKKRYDSNDEETTSTSSNERTSRRRRHDSDDDDSQRTDTRTRTRRERYDSDDEQDCNKMRKRLDSDDSNKRRKTKKLSRYPSSSSDNDDDDNDGKRMKSGHKAGLNNISQFRDAQNKMTKKKNRKGVSKSTARDQYDTVYRDKEGKKINVNDLDVEKQKVKDETADKDLNMGAYQKQQMMNLAQTTAMMKESTFARSINDTSVEKWKQDQLREGDPMAKFMSSSKRDAPAKKIYKGPPPKPNRFGIRPGYRWDGNDRGNGFEDKVIAQIYSKGRKDEDRYKWSCADM